MHSLNKVSGGTLEEWQKTSKEDGSVSNSSSSTTTGRESSVYDESEANKARDGSGSSNDSGSTVKAFKESTQDESCSSGSRSEQAQDSEQQKQQNSLKTAGPMESIGSVGHPDKCKPCAFYCFSLCGCRLDRDCAYCHLFHQSRLKQRREEWKRTQRQRRNKQRPKTSGEVTTTATLLTPGALGTLVEGNGQPNAAGVVPSNPGLLTPLLSVGPSAHVQAPYVPEVSSDLVSPAPGLLAPLLPQASFFPPEMPLQARANGASSTNGYAEQGANHGEETLEGLIQQVSMNTALLRTLLPVLSNLPTANKMASLLAGQAEVTNSHGAYNSNGPAPLPANSLQDNFSDLAAQGVMDFFEYVPNSLEVFVGQMLELWPPVTQMRGMIFAVAPRLPAGLSLDERSGLLHGRPQERTVGQVTYFITACNPQRTPTKVSVALVKLTVNHAFDHTMQY